MQWKKSSFPIGDFPESIRQHQSQASEMSFANMFMWRKNYNTIYSVIDDMHDIQFKNDQAFCIYSGSFGRV